MYSPPANEWKMSEKYTKNKEINMTFVKLPFKFAPLIFFLCICFLPLLFWFLQTKTTEPLPTHVIQISTVRSTKPTCNANVSVYVYELPAEFNLGLLKDCHHLNHYTDMCPYVANSGLGGPVSDMGSTRTSWFKTYQFIAEMLFHARLENHPCRTWDPARANLFYVPFYGGLDASRNIPARDSLPIKLVEYLRGQPTWQKHYGKDHFLVLGRVAWEFTQTPGRTKKIPSCLLNLPPVHNMSVLTVERYENEYDASNQHAIPYPTCFHPSTSDEMLTWQSEMSSRNRPHLFSFVGNKRKGVQKAEIRDEIVSQCGESTRCELLKCGEGGKSCYEPSVVLNVMTRSEFCLQPPGDTFTRRSTFDSVLAGCIPVFFSPHSAYTQYTWFFPADPAAYSVYIRDFGNTTSFNKSIDIDIEAELLKIPREARERMRNRVIDLIPRITYAHPSTSRHRYHLPDAVDVALAALSNKLAAAVDTAGLSSIN